MDNHNQTNEIIFFVAATTVILALLTILVVNLLLVGRNRRLKHRSDMMEMKVNYEREHMKTQVEVTEQTLNDIARELHDDVQQMITFSIIQLNSIDASNSGNLENQISAVRTSLQNTVESIRGIGKTLSNDYITSFGIYESLQRLFERISKQGIIHAQLLFPENVFFRSRPNELFAFRIIQELVSNTLKHAHATQIRLKVSEEDSKLIIEYRDNGKGINEGTLTSNQLKNSMGFTNIYKRAELMKATIEIRSDEGFHFLLTFPNE